LLKDSQQRY